MPIIVVTSMATGTLYIQAITNSLHAPGADKSVEMLNYVIVAMLSVFAAIDPVFPVAPSTTYMSSLPEFLPFFLPFFLCVPLRLCGKFLFLFVSFTLSMASAP